MTVRIRPSPTTIASPSPVPAAMTARLPRRGVPDWSDTSSSSARVRPLRRPRGDPHHRRQELEPLRLLPLERVAPDDGAEAATDADGAHLVEDLVVLGGGATGEDHDAAAVEGGLHHVANALGQR